jgi:hypothetical protein
MYDAHRAALAGADDSCTVESMEHEAAALCLYKELLSAVGGRSVMLENARGK